MNDLPERSDHPELEERLRALGSQPIDPATQSAHLTAMAAVRPQPSIAQKLRVAGALVGGIFIGSTGLAFAGALPDPAQDAVSEVASRVGLSVPVGTERYFGPECVASGDGADGPSFARNRGQYLKQERAKGPDALAAAKETDCGKPLVAVLGGGDDPDEIDEADTDEAEAGTEGRPDHAGCAADARARGRAAGAVGAAGEERDGKGKPSWAGKPGGAGGAGTSNRGTGKPECVPEDEIEPADSKEPAPSEEPVEAPSEEPADAPSQEPADAPSQQPSNGQVPPDVPPSGGEEGPDEVPPAGEGTDQAGDGEERRDSPPAEAPAGS